MNEGSFLKISVIGNVTFFVQEGTGKHKTHIITRFFPLFPFYNAIKYVVLGLFTTDHSISQQAAKDQRHEQNQ